MNKSNALGRCLSAMFAVAGLIGASCSLGSVAQAQVQPQKGKPDAGAAGANTAMEIAKAEGTLEAQQGQRIKISTADKKDVFIELSQDTSLKYTAEAEASWLSPGLMIRFSTKFEQGKPTAALKSLEVFMPVMYRRMSMEQMREQTPGLYQEGKTLPLDAKGLFAEDNKKAGGKPGSRPNNAAPPSAAAGGSPTFRVVGKLIGVHNNVLMVMTDKPMQFELDPAVAISVTAGDLSFAMQGDTVAVSGLRSPAEPAFIRAEKVEIKAAKKLAQAQVAPRGGRARPGARGKANAADDKDAKGGQDDKPGSKPTDSKRPGANSKKPGSTTGTQTK